MRRRFERLEFWGPGIGSLELAFESVPQGSMSQGLVPRQAALPAAPCSHLKIEQSQKEALTQEIQPLPLQSAFSPWVSGVAVR